MAASTLAELDGVILDGLEFCKGVYGLFESIRQAPNGSDRLRLRTSNTERKLLGELLPICKYIHARYRVGRYISVRWIDGDQSFDAELHQRGAYVDKGYYPEMSYLEVTSAMHKNEHWMWEMLGSGRPVFAPEGITKPKKKEAVSEQVVFTNDEHVQNFVQIVLEQLAKKTQIPYPTETSLIMQCNLNNLYMLDDWELLVREVTRRMPEHQFREILLYDVMREYISTL